MVKEKRFKQSNSKRKKLWTVVIEDEIINGTVNRTGDSPWVNKYELKEAKTLNFVYRGILKRRVVPSHDWRGEVVCRDLKKSRR